MAVAENCGRGYEDSMKPLKFVLAAMLPVVLLGACFGSAGCATSNDSEGNNAAWIPQASKLCDVESRSLDETIELRWTCQTKGPVESVVVSRDTGASGRWSIGAPGDEVGEVVSGDHRRGCRVSGQGRWKIASCVGVSIGRASDLELTVRLPRVAGVCGAKVTASFWARIPRQTSSNFAVDGILPTC